MWCWMKKDAKATPLRRVTTFQIKMRVRFHEDIQEPILAYTFKNIPGERRSPGTNTMYEKASVEHPQAGRECVVTL